MYVSLVTFALAAVLVKSQDLCASNICKNGGVCIKVLGNPSCACPGGFGGAYCETASNGPTATPATITCPTTNEYNVGCDPAEVIFMLEYSRLDTGTSVKLEGEYILEHLDRWWLDDQHVRVGLVIYHDTVAESIHIDEYKNDKIGLKARIQQIARGLNESGEPDLEKAFDYVRQNSFKGARDNVARVVVPFIHQMPQNGHDKIIAAAQRLKDDCATIIAFGVYSPCPTINFDTVHKIVTPPVRDHYAIYDTYDDMETDAMGKYCPH